MSFWYFLVHFLFFCNFYLLYLNSDSHSPRRSRSRMSPIMWIRVWIHIICIMEIKYILKMYSKYEDIWRLGNVLFSAPPSFNYNLSCEVNITGFILRNTHNDIYNDAGTRAYAIIDAITNTTITRSISPNPQNLVCTV